MAKIYDSKQKKYVDEVLKKENIEKIMNSTITKINGEKHLESIEIVNQEGKTNTIEINGLFIAIGQAPKNEIFKNIKVENGYIKSEDGVHTNIKGIYVAGDSREKELRQLTTAVSDGAIAATTAIKEMED